MRAPVYAVSAAAAAAAASGVVVKRPNSTVHYRHVELCVQCIGVIFEWSYCWQFLLCWCLVCCRKGSINKTPKVIKRELTRIHVKPVAHSEIKLKQNTETACDSLTFVSVSLAYF